MKRTICIVIIVLTVTLQPLSARQKGPIIEFDSVTKQVDKVTDGEVVSLVFTFTNKGDAQLEILAVEPACGCTSALPVPNKVAPGQSGKIEIKITTEGLAAGSRTVAETVSMNKTVTVRSNDTRQPQVVLTINGTVAPEIVISDRDVYLGSSPRGKEAVKDVILEIAPDRPVEIVRATSTDDNVTVSLEPVAGANGKKVRLVLTQKATAGEGVHRGTILIKTTSQLKPELKITFRSIVTKG
jgi:hypothetical protein